MPKTFQIQIQDDGTVANAICKLSKKENDDVRWYTKRKSWHVEFPHESPFSLAAFDVTPENPFGSGPLRADTAEGQYWYTITDTQTGKSLDPIIVVDR